MKFVVFDTGTGGKLFAKKLRGAMPGVQVVEVIDDTNSPYGNKSEAAIRRLSEAALRPYIGRVAVIVIACNTVTAVAIDYLRQRYPEQIFVGMEPMLKPATMLTKTGKIMVLATDATKNSARYKNLKYKWGRGVEIFEPNCKKWAGKIDHGEMNDEVLRMSLEPYMNKGVDVVALACTHFVAVKSQVQQLMLGAKVIDPFEAVIRQIKRLVK
jgi:glutamate racemase